MPSASKVALVTGAQQGIGRATALTLAQQGYDLALHFLDDEAAVVALGEEITALGQRTSRHRADLVDTGAAQRLVEEAFETHGRLDGVVNNAGIFHRATLDELTVGLWDLTLDVNLRAATFVIQAAVAQMRRTGTRGAIVNVSSVAAFGTARGIHYSASKGGLDAMTRAAALDVARDGIRINGVAPGMVLTAQALEGDAREELERIAAATVAGRIGRPEEIAAVIAFLLSDAASFINGEVIQANGGARMG
ncbi:SDR family oxidoreductase [Kaistia geumhonensis]|uniref:NAD(P)-dependent dehydrogenase (Short-subunit alcohol dehydrogenase family) n=1 Tax=Kaistia geumhonensis TaxID=410839 RepID=A0ABU0M3Z7_9HYPH|nr:SDR family oxidoreductase [Kaistia geumhonensis]MCX5479100.1 SDR family oxidoreductase [Kaistia geumhonensis]MDQ0515680.1 NAD(P)-dependent dehydrogenase (short-subunit alcohol dehydrogenase family) [Kaistia geumhonensis]